MEAKLTELNAQLDALINESYQLGYQKTDFENMMREKESENFHSIKNMKIEIEGLRNQIGSGVLLTSESEIQLRKELVAIAHILNCPGSDKSQVTLVFDVPIPDSKPYSIHTDLNSSWNISFNITIKTKSPDVEKIVRETILQDKNIQHHGETTDEDREFDKTLRRKWSDDRHNELSIMFNHKPIDYDD